MYKNIWIVPLEKIETRYTCEWFDHIPQMIQDYSQQRGLGATQFTIGKNTDLSRLHTKPKHIINIYNIVGDVAQQEATSGSFINFAATNIWKSSQAVLLSQLFTQGHIKSGDKLYFTDAWNPIILMCKYMKDLCGIDVEIHAQWHAGWHDPHDQLAQRIKEPTWAKHTEQSLFYAIDKNYFTTEFYRNLFFERLHLSPNWEGKTVRCGYPNSYLTALGKGKPVKKENLVVFPHRLAAEKQIDFFDAITPALESRGITVDVCQRNNYTKQQYHDVLRRAKVVVSFALQETYGIAQTEAVFANALPLSPDRLSYSEMYRNEFIMPSYWTETSELCERYKDRTIDRIVSMVEQYTSYNRVLQKSKEHLLENYIGDKIICENLLR